MLFIPFQQFINLSEVLESLYYSHDHRVFTLIKDHQHYVSIQPYRLSNIKLTKDQKAIELELADGLGTECLSLELSEALYDMGIDINVNISKR